MNRKDIDLQISENQLLAAKLKAAGNIVNAWAVIVAQGRTIHGLADMAETSSTFIIQNLKGSDEPQASQ